MLIMNECRRVSCRLFVKGRGLVRMCVLVHALERVLDVRRVPVLQIVVPKLDKVDQPNITRDHLCDFVAVLVDSPAQLTNAVAAVAVVLRDVPYSREVPKLAGEKLPVLLPLLVPVVILFKHVL